MRFFVLAATHEIISRRMIRNMQAHKSKLEELKNKKDSILERLNNRIAEAQRVEDARQRKDATRYKIILGACLLADLESNPQLGPVLEQSLKRTASPRDAEYLRSKGWRV